MSIQSVVQEAATNIDNVLERFHKRMMSSLLCTGHQDQTVQVNANDLSLVMEALAATWPPKKTIEDLTAKVQYLLDEYVSCKEGEVHFMFPDGDSWVVRNKTKKEDTK